jgi:hypothetical protein
MGIVEVCNSQIPHNDYYHLFNHLKKNDNAINDYINFTFTNSVKNNIINGIGEFKRITTFEEYENKLNDINELSKAINDFENKLNNDNMYSMNNVREKFNNFKYYYSYYLFFKWAICQTSSYNNESRTWGQHRCARVCGDPSRYCGGGSGYHIDVKTNLFTNKNDYIYSINGNKSNSFADEYLKKVVWNPCQSYYGSGHFWERVRRVGVGTEGDYVYNKLNDNISQLQKFESQMNPEKGINESFNFLKEYKEDCKQYLKNLQKFNILNSVIAGDPIYKGMSNYKYDFLYNQIDQKEITKNAYGRNFTFKQMKFKDYYMKLNKFKIDKENNDNYLYNIDYGNAYNQSSYICPSLDGKSCMKYKEEYKISEKIPIISGSNVYAITCNSSGKEQTINEKKIYPSNLCKMKYDYYNLYKTNNPYLVKGRNIYQDLPNQIDNSTQLAEITSDYNKFFKNTANTDQSRKDAINAKLSSGPLKLACCNVTDNTKEFQYNFNVPIDPNNKDISRDLKIKKYENEKITIPEGSCKVLTDEGYEKYSDQCNLFMKLYCDNMVIEYNKLNLNEITFADYCPECACYAPRTELETNIPDGISPKCYKNDCIDNSISYLDPISQVNTCQTTICNNIVNASDIAAGGDAKFNLRLSNECGAQIAAAKDSFNQKKVESDRLEKIDRLIESASLEDRNEYYETVNKQINFNDDKINKLLKLQLKLKSKIEELENSKIQSDEIQQQIINDKIQTEELQKEIDNIEIKNDKLENDKLEQQKIEQQELEQQELDKLNLEKQKIEQENLNEENLNEENLNEENLSYKNNNMAITEEETSTYTIIYIICGIVCCIILIIIIFYFMSSGRRKRMGRGRGMGR